MPTVLAVDDDPVILNLLKKFLEQKSYTVVTASDGIEALEKVAREKPAVVLLDVYMPRKSGLEVLREIKQSHSDVAVIMVTAVTDEVVGQTALTMGALDYIVKPFDLDYLERVLWWKLKLMG